MSESAVVFLGIMAAALAVMAAAQIALMVAALRMAKQVTTTAEDLRRDLRPLIDRANHLTEEATRVTALALTQVERIDHLMATTARRVDDTMEVMQGLMAGPIRQGSAMFAAFKAAMAVVRQIQSRRSPSRDADEDALFVG